MVEQERNRIARDMLDVVAHSLAVVIAQADGARYTLESDPVAMDAALTTISITAREALGNVRILLGQPRHTQGETAQPMMVDLDALVEHLQSSGLVVSRETVGEDRPLDTAQQLAVYRITQEALTNALRHGDTAREARFIFAWRHDVFVSSFRVRSTIHSVLKRPSRTATATATASATASRECGNAGASGAGPFRVGLVDDQPLFRAGVRMLGNSPADLEVVERPATASRP